MPKNCKFFFNRESAIYYSGEQIFGNVVFTTTKDLKIESLHIHCRGVAQVEWFEPSQFPQPFVEHNDCVLQTENVSHQGYEVYVNQCLSDFINPEKLIAAGSHVFPFAFRLPPFCPATCSQKHGDVSYSVNLLLRRRFKFEKTFNRRFEVRNRLDLNAVVGEEKQRPHSVSEIFTWANLTLHAPHLKSLARPVTSLIHFSTPRSGFAPGQRIPCCMRLSTSTGHAPASIAACKKLKFQVRLCQKYLFRAQLPTPKRKEVVRKLAVAKSGNRIARESGDGVVGRFECSLQLPLLTPMSSPNSDALISVSYHLELRVFGRRKKLLAKLHLPISVGMRGGEGVASDDKFKEYVDESATGQPMAVHSDQNPLLGAHRPQKPHEGFFRKHFRDMLKKRLSMAL